MLKQTTIVNVSFHLRANFQKSFENSMILPAALSGRFSFIFQQLVSLRVANAAPCRSVSHVDRGWWASFFGPAQPPRMGVVFGPLLDIWNLFLCLS